MRLTRYNSLSRFLCAASLTAVITAGGAELVKRADNQADIVGLSSTDPVQAAKLVQQIPSLPGNNTILPDYTLQVVSGDSNTAQLPWNPNVPFVQTPNTTMSPEQGWNFIPDLPGFDLNRTWEVLPGAIIPFYIKSGLDSAAVKRAIISMPGKPRDAWKYANLYRNALSVVEANQTSGVTSNSVLIVSPIWLNQLDQAGGAAKSNELVFHGSGWEYGGNSIYPNLTHKISTYAVIDNFTDMLFNKALYPNLNQVIIAGHSMGGQAAHRYAILKKRKVYDDNMSYWVGNPGSWTYLSSARPYNNASCTDTFDTWHYGLGQNTTKIPKYARNDVLIDRNAVVRRYLQRKVHMALGLLDYGPGDTHCQALDQGASHLDRGSQMVLHLASVNNGTFPPSQTVDFIANTSHQDYAMISTNQSLYWLFEHDYDVRYPDVNATNPSDAIRPRVHGHKPATRKEVLLATSMMGGSLFFVIAFFTILPFLFTPNWQEEEKPLRPFPAQDHHHTTFGMGTTSTTKSHINTNYGQLAIPSDIKLVDPESARIFRGSISHSESSFSSPTFPPYGTSTTTTTLLRREANTPLL